ncbi:MAG: hypothetical protein EOO41_00070 [Methanobacteriota archaeon]|nr:MAG: hypothetical protein EOO41_00070 [Euryarchaeota archaeon]
MQIAPAFSALALRPAEAAAAKADADAMNAEIQRLIVEAPPAASAAAAADVSAARASMLQHTKHHSAAHDPARANTSTDCSSVGGIPSAPPATCTAQAASSSPGGAASTSSSPSTSQPRVRRAVLNPFADVSTLEASGNSASAPADAGVCAGARGASAPDVYSSGGYVPTGLKVSSTGGLPSGTTTLHAAAAQGEYTAKGLSSLTFRSLSASAPVASSTGTGTLQASSSGSSSGGGAATRALASAVLSGTDVGYTPSSLSSQTAVRAGSGPSSLGSGGLSAGWEARNGTGSTAGSDAMLSRAAPSLSQRSVPDVQ